jgi:hypothetical protein
MRLSMPRDPNTYGEVLKERLRNWAFPVCMDALREIERLERLLREKDREIEELTSKRKYIRL